MWAEAGEWLGQQAIKRAPIALAGIAGAAGLGYLASRGQVRGAAAGATNLGGAPGAMAGATLGFAAGAGLMAAGMYSPSFRPAVGRFLTKVLSSAPIQKIASTLESMPASGASRIGNLRISSFIQDFANPQAQAAQHLIDILKRKQASVLYGAVPGALGGLAVGGSLGYLSGAWRAGARLSGPQRAQY